MFTETPCVFTIEENREPYTIPCEVGPENFLHINAGLSENQQAQLRKVLKKQAGAFAWEYTDMKVYIVIPIFTIFIWIQACHM